MNIKATATTTTAKASDTAQHLINSLLCLISKNCQTTLDEMEEKTIELTVFIDTYKKIEP